MQPRIYRDQAPQQRTDLRVPHHIILGYGLSATGQTRHLRCLCDVGRRIAACRRTTSGPMPEVVQAGERAVLAYCTKPAPRLGSARSDDPLSLVLDVARRSEQMPADACQIVNECTGCGKALRPRPLFCSRDQCRARRGKRSNAAKRRAVVDREVTRRGRANCVRSMDQALRRLPMLLHCAGRLGRCILAFN